MAKFEPLHKGPILSLAIMAMLALAIPFYAMTKDNVSVKESNAMRLRLPTNEPRYEGGSVPYPTVSPRSSATPRPTMGTTKTYGY